MTAASSDRTLSQIATKLKAIDTCMFVTKTGEQSDIAARPMSNNGDVSSDDGTFYHFATDDGRIDNDLNASKRCGATYTDGEFYAAVQGSAELIRDREVHERHWVPDLEKWFEDGLDTEGLILIKFTPDRINWWDGRDNGELMPGN